MHAIFSPFRRNDRWTNTTNTGNNLVNFLNIKYYKNFTNTLEIPVYDSIWMLQCCSWIWSMEPLTDLAGSTKENKKNKQSNNLFVTISMAASIECYGAYALNALTNQANSAFWAWTFTRPMLPPLSHGRVHASQAQEKSTASPPLSQEKEIKKIPLHTPVTQIHFPREKLFRIHSNFLYPATERKICVLTNVQTLEFVTCFLHWRCICISCNCFWFYIYGFLFLVGFVHMFPNAFDMHVIGSDLSTCKYHRHVVYKVHSFSKINIPYSLLLHFCFWSHTF